MRARARVGAQIAALGLMLVASRRTGYGRIDPDGRIELFDSRGERQKTIVPSPRPPDRTR